MIILKIIEKQTYITKLHIPLMRGNLFPSFGLAVLAVTLISAILISSCMASQAQTEQEFKNIIVIDFINGFQGDKSFFDSAVRGISRAEADFGLDVKTIEASYDPATWQPALEYAASHEDYDILIAGTEQMSQILQAVAAKHPDKKFILYDAEVNYTVCDCRNVYSIRYKQNEGSYLAGVYAALMSKSKVIGVIGGQNISVINDFIIGYEQGAEDTRPDIKVLKSYADGWNDPAMGRQLALGMFRQGADIIFQVAGNTGTGVFQAARESGGYAIGVDSDQALLMKDTEPEQARLILTSMMKNVDNSLYRALKLYREGRLPFGQTEYLGLKEGGVGLARNKYYQEATPSEVKLKVDEAERDIVEGKITVKADKP
jgi:basic membrane protein A